MAINRKGKLLITAFGLYISGLLLAPIVLIILPTDFFDNGKSMCISVILLDRNCYGCGMTRAIQHLIHLEFKIAFEYNKLSIIVFPLLTIIWFNELKRIYKKINKSK